MLIVVKPALGEVARSGPAPTVSRDEMHSLVQTKAVLDTIVKSVLSNKGFMVSIAETFGNTVDGGNDEYGPWDMEEASTTGVDEPSTAHSPPRTTRPSKDRLTLSLSRSPFIAIVIAVARPVATTGKICIERTVFDV